MCILSGKELLRIINIVLLKYINMQMVRWIFEKMLFFEFYGYEKNSREIDVSRMYLMIWVITFYHLIAIAIIIMRLCAIVLHINAIGLSIPILVITFLTVTIQEITLKKKKYIQTLIEAYRVMHQEEKKRLAREGLYYRVLPILGLTALYILLVVLAWLHII